MRQSVWGQLRLACSSIALTNDSCHWFVALFSGSTENYPLVVKHTEDEIGAINQALGAALLVCGAMTGHPGEVMH